MAKIRKIDVVSKKTILSTKINPTHMAIPDYESIMLPLLKFSEKRSEFSSKDAVTNMATEFALKEEKKNALLPNGKQTIIYNRVHWALSYLKHSKLLENTKKGVYKITDRVKQILSEKPAKIDSELLKQFPEYTDFINMTGTKERGRSDIVESDASQTPEEKFEESYQLIRDDLKSQLLDTIKGCSPAFFEKLVVELLVLMGYGGSIKEAGKAIGKSGDEGIDGVIKEDVLGLDVIYM